MEKKQFKIVINATREKVWDALWGATTYPEWTSVFSPGSRAESDWNEGSKVFFLGGDNEGMLSMIVRKIPNEFMSFKHLGMVKNGVEDIESSVGQEWVGSMENYTLRTVEGKTELEVDMDIAVAHLDYFMDAWPKALAKLKEIAER